MNVMHSMTLIAGLLVAAHVQAAPFAQSADIAANAKLSLDHVSEMASYYKDGKTGDVTFVCDLEGQDALAVMVPGKNFVGNAFDILKVGMNGPYKWTLHDAHENNGNIKITLSRGEKATIQCMQVS